MNDVASWIREAEFLPATQKLLVLRHVLTVVETRMGFTAMSRMGTDTERARALAQMYRQLENLTAEISRVLHEVPLVIVTKDE